MSFFQTSSPKADSFDLQSVSSPLGFPFFFFFLSQLVQLALCECVGGAKKHSSYVKPDFFFPQYDE